MYSRMLVPLDGSKLAEGVLPYAREIAGRIDLATVLLHVYGAQESQFLNMRRAYLEHVREDLTTQVRKLRRRSGTRLKMEPVDIQVRLAKGDAAGQILNYVEKNDIDLILMATHGRSGLQRWALGSVADKVLRTSPVPVFLVRRGIREQTIRLDWPKITILVPLDGSRTSEAVLPHVEALAKPMGAANVDVVLLGVSEPEFITADYPEATMTLTWQEHCERISAHFTARSRDYLAEVADGLRRAGLNVRSELLVGEAADQIVKYANKTPVSLVAMATHGRSGLTRWAYGSAAQKVLQGVASSPVLLVRPSTAARPRARKKAKA